MSRSGIPEGHFFFSTFSEIANVVPRKVQTIKSLLFICASVKSPLDPRTAVSGGGLVEVDGLGNGLAAYCEKAFGASFGKTSHHISDHLHKQKIKFTFRSRSEPERQYHRCCGRCVLCRPRRAPRILRDRLLGGQTSHCLRKLTYLRR